MEDMTKEVKKLNVDPTYYKDLVIENEEEKFYRTAIKQGYKDGVEKGIEQGIEQGIKQGSYDSKVQIVKNMLKYSIKIDDISNITGLSIEDINDIKKQII